MSKQRRQERCQLTLDGGRDAVRARGKKATEVRARGVAVQLTIDGDCEPAKTLVSQAMREREAADEAAGKVAK